MPSRYSSYYRRALCLAIFLFGLLGGGQNAMAQYDTVWTRMTERSIVQVAFHPNSQLIATGTWDSYLSIWDIGGNELQRLWGARSNRGVEFSSDGKFLTYGGGDLDEGAVKVVDCITWQEFRKIECPTNSVTFINDSNLIAIGGRTDIRIWDFQKNEVIKYIDSIVGPDFGGSYYELHKMVYSPMNNSIIYTASDGKLRFYNLNKGIIEYTYNAGYGEIAISNDFNYIAFKTGLSGLAVQIMDVETKQIVQTLPGSASGINSIVFSPDDKYLAVAYEYAKVLKIWDIQTGQNVYSYIEKPGWYFNAIDWSNDNLYIVGGTNGAMFLYKNKLVGVHEEDKSFDTLYPNPTNLNLTIQFNYPISDNVTINLLSLEGKLIRNIFDGFLESGEHKIIAETTGIASGNYFIVIHSDTFSKTLKLMVMR